MGIIGAYFVFISRGADREMTLLALLVRVLSVFYV